MLSWLKILGPGLAVAATGIGAGDMVAATVSGARYGMVILWAAMFGAAFKYVLNEGIARWQLASGTTLLEGWVCRMGRWVGLYFAFYLVLWSFIVGGALIAACGLAGHALFGSLSVAGWGVAHSVVAVLLVLLGRYALFERLMKLLVAAMFGIILWSAVMVRPGMADLFSGLLVLRVPEGSTTFILGVMGGVGGSVTLLSYGYWMREKGWAGAGRRRTVRVDLGVAYVLTGLFGVAMIIIAAGVNPREVAGPRIVLEVAQRLEELSGPAGRWVFLTGFWAAVFSSMIGVWQGMPYIFADFVSTWRARSRGSSTAQTTTASSLYRGYLFYLAFPPMILLLIDKPVWIVVAYAVVGALFMPFLAGTLLVMNNRRGWVGVLKNSRVVNLLLGLALALFVYLATAELIRVL